MAPFLLSVLLLLLLGAPLGGAFEELRLTRCPHGNLTLTVPEDLMVGSALLSWDPARLLVQSQRENFKRIRDKALSHLRVSANARAFFSDGPEDAFSVVPGATRATLNRALPVGGSDLLRGRFALTCTPTGGSGAPSDFVLHLRLLRRPLRLMAEPPRPLLASWSPAGTALANLSTFAYGRRVAPSACSVVSGETTRGADLTVSGDGRVSLAAPLESPAANAAEWTAVVTCEWRGALARLHLRVAPFRLWRRRHSRLRAAASDATAALAFTRIEVDLGALLVRPGLRVRLVGASDPDRVRLVPTASRLLLDLAPDGAPLAVTLEAADAEGRTDLTTLLVTGGPAEPATPEAAPCPRAWPWWPATLLVGAAALCLACAWPVLRRLLRRGRGETADTKSSAFVKPQFV